MMFREKRGFTLVELLLYSALFAVVGGLMTGVLVTTMRTQNRDAASNEVTQQLNFVINTVQRLVRESSLIEYSYEGDATGTACSTYCSLRLRMEASSTDPTVITSDASGVYIQEGNGAEVPLTTDEITVDNILFTKFESPGGHATIQIDATFSRNTENPQFAVTKRAQSSISRASAASFDSNLIPNASDAFDIGQLGALWQDLILSKDLTVGNDALITGDLGVGTSTPTAKLHAKADTDTQISGWGTVVAKFDSSGISDYPGIAFIGTSGAHGEIRISNGNGFSFVTFVNGASGTEALRILESGNVGVGATNPTAKFEVADGGVAAGSKLILVGDDTYLTDIDVANMAGLYGNQNSDRAGLRLGSDDSYIFGDGGYIGIGKNNPGTKLDVSGDVTANAYYYSSDISLKTAIQPFVDALSGIIELEPIRFVWKNTGDSDIGFIAQEVEKLFPESVRTDENTGLKYVDYAKLTVPLIGAIQEQQKEIDALRAEVDLMRAEIESLRVGDE